jgi:hypothetical protein
MAESPDFSLRPNNGNSLEKMVVNQAEQIKENPNFENNCLNLDQIKDEVSVCQLRSASMFRVDVTLNSLKLNAVVDTAAEVTIISDSVYRQMSPKPTVVKTIKLHTAGRALDMIGFVIGPISMNLGPFQFNEYVYVAPIEDEMLLGVDFLSSNGVILDMKDSKLTLREHSIPMVQKSGRKEPCIAKVYIDKRTVIPPNSMKHVHCHMGDDLYQYMIEPLESSKVFVAKSVHIHDSHPKICVLNLSNRYATLKRNRPIATAHLATTVQPIPLSLLEGVGTGRPNEQLATKQLDTTNPTRPSVMSSCVEVSEVK